MKILDVNGKPVKNPDLDLGYLKNETLVIAHHEAEPEVPMKTKRVLVTTSEDGHSGLFKRIVVQEHVPAKPAWDETEEIQRYIRYTDEELAEMAAKKAAEEAERERLEAEQADRDAKQAEIAAWLAAAPDALMEVAGLAAATDEKASDIEDALIELAAIVAGKE